MVQILFILAALLSAEFTTQLKAETPIKMQLIGGERVSSSLHPQVARLSLNGAGLCTGTLIAPDALITAAHCFFDDRNSRSVGDTDVVATFAVGSFRSRLVFINPNYVPRSEACIEGETDIAIVLLESNVSGVEPSKVSSSAPFVGSQIELVGYGSEGDENFGMNGVLPPSGFVNQGNTVIENLSTSYLEWKFDRNETNTAGGDSGGPAFSQTNDHAITSITCGGGGNAELGTDSLNTRLDIALPWIKSIVPSLKIAAPEPLKISGSTFFVGDEISIPIILSSSQNANLNFSSLPSGFVFDGRYLKGVPLSSGFYSISVTSENAYGVSTGAVEFSAIDALPFSGKAKGSVTFREGGNRAEKTVLDIPIRLSKGMRVFGTRISITVFGVRKTFRLDRLGFAELNDGSTIKIKSNISNGKLTRASTRLHIELKRIVPHDGFSISGVLSGKSTPTLPVRISADGNIYKGEVITKYSRARN